MKKLILTTLAVLVAYSAVWAQYDKEGKFQYRKFTDFKKVHWGFTAGINKVDFRIYKNNNFLNNDSVTYLADC